MSFRGIKTRLLVLVGLAALMLLSGCEFHYSSFTIDCEGFTVNGIGDNVTNIANLDLGIPDVPVLEQIGLRAYDGAGNVLFENDAWAGGPLGTRPSDVGFHSDSVVWVTAPLFNPITVQYYNPANGILPGEIIIATFKGTCEGLPTRGGKQPADEQVQVEQVKPPDDRLNWGYCDLKAAIYGRTGPDGGPALHVYGVDGESNGHFLLDVTGPDLAPYIASLPQGQNVLIEEAGPVQLYALISGEFSLHIHMDDQGNVCAWVFDGLPPANTHVVNYNMYQ